MIKAKIPKEIEPSSEHQTLEATLISPDELTSDEGKAFYEKMTNDNELPPGGFWQTFKIKKNGYFYEAVCLFFYDVFNKFIKHDTTFLFPLEEKRKSYFLIRDNEEWEKALLEAIKSTLD